MLERIDKRLHVDGVDLVALAEAHGTPLFVYSADRIREVIADVRSVIDEVHPRTTIAFAAKACPLLAILRLIDEAGCALEVNSDGELARVQRAGLDTDTVVANGVARSERELKALIDARVRAINVDSLSELRRLIGLAGDGRPRVALRVIPGLDAMTTPGTDTASANTKFGMTLDELDEAIELCADAPVDLVGLHVHVGSQVTEPEVYGAAGEFVVDLLDRLDLDLEFVNVGGGFPVDYTRGRSELPHYLRVTDFQPHIHRLLNPLADAHPELDVIIEPGRLIVADSAVLITRVEAEKPRPDRQWLFLDAGYHTMLEAFTYKWFYDLAHVERGVFYESEDYTVVGPLCDSGDSFSDVDGQGLVDRLVAEHPDLDRAMLESQLVRLPSTRNLPPGTGVGDLLLFLDCGAYTQDQIYGINGRGRPAVVLVDGGTPRVIRDADTVEQLWLNERD